MKSSTSFRFSSVFFFFFILFIVAAVAEDSNIAEEDSTDTTYLQADTCVYSLNIQTGTDIDAGTDSRISLRLGNGRGAFFQIPQITRWGVFRPGHAFFERGSLDTFVGNGPCLPSRVCRITVTSDGTGFKPRWFLDNVDITITGPNRPRTRNIFPVNQWLSISNAPFQLSTTRDNCGFGEGGVEAGLDIA